MPMFSFVNQQFTKVLFQHFSVQKYSSTNFIAESTITVRFFLVKSAVISIYYSAIYTQSALPHQKKVEVGSEIFSAIPT